MLEEYRILYSYSGKFSFCIGTQVALLKENISRKIQIPIKSFGIHLSVSMTWPFVLFCCSKVTNSKQIQIPELPIPNTSFGIYKFGIYDLAFFCSKWQIPDKLEYRMSIPNHNSVFTQVLVFGIYYSCIYPESPLSECEYRTCGWIFTFIFYSRYLCLRNVNRTQSHFSNTEPIPKPEYRIPDKPNPNPRSLI